MRCTVAAKPPSPKRLTRWPELEPHRRRPWPGDARRPVSHQLHGPCIWLVSGQLAELRLWEAAHKLLGPSPRQLPDLLSAVHIVVAVAWRAHTQRRVGRCGRQQAHTRSLLCGDGATLADPSAFGCAAASPPTGPPPSSRPPHPSRAADRAHTHQRVEFSVELLVRYSGRDIELVVGFLRERIAVAALLPAQWRALLSS